LKNKKERKLKEEYKKKYYWEFWGEINTRDTKHLYFQTIPVKTKSKLIIKWYDFVPYEIRTDYDNGGFQISSRQCEFLINGRSIPARNNFDLNNVEDGIDLCYYLYGIPSSDPV
jgi:hypothetical protein